MKIGILSGAENTFPAALVDRINALRSPDLTAEHVKTGAVRLAEPCPYRVIIDRVSHEVPFYGAWLKSAALGPTTVINDPFRSSADDRFLNFALASKLGVAVPRTLLLPHKAHPPGTAGRSFGNLIYPLDWDGVFSQIGFPAVLKPHNGGAKLVYRVNNPEEFFRAYDATGPLCMMFQQAIDSTERFRCYVVGREQVRVIPYEPRPPESSVQTRMIQDSLTLCRALGYDLSAVEFALRDGVPYAIDFLNPAPDADRESVGSANFDWIVRTVADLAVAEALKDPLPRDLRAWRVFAPFA